MPQTSPMNWIMLSMFVIASTLYIFTLINEKTLKKEIKKSNFNLTTWPWNW